MVCAKRKSRSSAPSAMLVVRTREPGRNGFVRRNSRTVSAAQVIWIAAQTRIVALPGYDLKRDLHVGQRLIGSGSTGARGAT